MREQDEKVATIPALVANVLKRPRRTCFCSSTLHIETVEHCWRPFPASRSTTSRFASPEGVGRCSPAAMDRASRSSTRSRRPASSSRRRRSIRWSSKACRVSNGDATTATFPARWAEAEVIYTYEAAAPIGRQTVTFYLDDDDFVTQLAPARTFVFENEAREMQARGLGKHLSPKDLLVISGWADRQCFPFPR